MRNVQQGAFDMVGRKGAADAALLPGGTKHEMLNDELAPPLEKLGERLLTVPRIEDVCLHPDPG